MVRPMRSKREAVEFFARSGCSGGGRWCLGGDEVEASGLVGVAFR